MSWMQWLPWRFVIRRIARNKGFLDPIALLARLHSAGDLLRWFAGRFCCFHRPRR